MRGLSGARLEDGPEQIGLVSGEADPMIDSPFDTNDADLVPILDQLSNHLRSMRENTQQLKDMQPAVTSASIALDSIT